MTRKQFKNKLNQLEILGWKCNQVALFANFAVLSKNGIEIKMGIYK